MMIGYFFGNRLGLPNERKDITVIKTIL
ncbi:hypothetical protein BG31_22565 [Bacillus subtilis subsp. subtilis]|nr:hypothetical protein BCM26_03760 [Bacillus subtilis]OJH64839.1 hypothetical protein BOH71_03785 [Bacillus subtilis]OTQ82251.1 hypothetical protein BG30_20800 [Bacillus subtilis subsp. subtilis]OTQ82267.1 hypothetical protein BG31_22565 [Bacillus subtilis subsp. subtilis]